MIIRCFPYKVLQVSGAKRRLRMSKTLRDFHLGNIWSISTCGTFVFNSPYQCTYKKWRADQPDQWTATG